MSDQSIKLIDIGANLTHNSFDSDRETVINEAITQGVTQSVVTGASLTGSREACELADQWPGVLFATAGIHPHHAKDWATDTDTQLRSIAMHKRIVAAGECGLDFFRNFSSPTEQQDAFVCQLEMAVDLQLPVFLHQRDAIDPFLEILDKYLDKIPRAVAHCFTGTGPELRQLLERDLYIGITGWICDERRGHHLRDMMADIPARRLMIETDAPYLLPRDLKPKPKSRRNEPKYLPHIAETVAECVDKPLQQVAEETTRTAREFFSLGK